MFMRMNNLPLFIAIHKWNPKDFNKVGKTVIETLPKLPKEVCLLHSWLEADLSGGWCIWEAESGEKLEKLLKGMIPDTMVKPVLTFAPPTQDLYQLLYVMMSQ
jgi:hypothetical protein